MDALMTLTALTYDDLAEIADILTRLFSAEGQGLDLNQQRGAAQGEGATLRGVLEFERERTSELSRFAQLAPRMLSSPARFRRGMPNTPSVGWATQACFGKRGDHWYRAATATPLGLFAKLRRAFG